MGIPSPILNAGFMQFGLSAFTMHDALLPPPVKAPVPGLVEGPAFMGWPAGIIAHKRDLTVLVDGNPGVQHGHDAGYFLPHLAAPVNAYMAVNTAFSKHKVPFPVSNVKIGASPAGTYLFILFGIICAQPVSLPTGVLIMLRCTVVTGLGPLDIVKGLLTIAIDVAFDWIWKKFTGTALGKKLVTKPFKEVALPKWVGAATINALGGAVFVIRETSGRAVNKAVDHLLKSFVASPMLTGLPFGKIGLGRGSWGPSFKFFSW
jgi:hypothetical protein